MYKITYNTFKELVMNDSAKLLKPKISALQAKIKEAIYEEEDAQSSRASSSNSRNRSKI